MVKKANDKKANKPAAKKSSYEVRETGAKEEARAGGVRAASRGTE
jgi:hypothetical protein